LRRRYIAIKVECEQPPPKNTIIDSIWKSLLQLFGEYGASQTDLKFIEYNPKERFMILRCSHDALNLVKTSISMITKIDDSKAALHIVYVSGTLKTLLKRITPLKG